MDLPTYTNIWRIEKRLYKLYDLRLPMPLPVVWIGVFVGVLVPWCFFLYLIGLPLEAPWHVVYLVPPGVLTWLSTRPVIESKRLTELLQSQVRYMTEPRTWCRMAPSGEPDEITVVARVWRAAPLAEGEGVRVPRKARRKAASKAGQVRITPGTAPVRGRRAGKQPRFPERALPSRLASPAEAESVAESPSRVVRPVVAAAAAAAAPVADSTVPGATTSRGTATAAGERVFSLAEPAAGPPRGGSTGSG
ncbi:conjugal transfer protein, partial [Microbispora sp. ATCC PTA-5024]|uniref:conjugal transfer protein n=1 Tax=Microbispora sp. ATCC PTA-5024 TaxID=316330 RepID=UPI0018DC24B4